MASFNSILKCLGAFVSGVSALTVPTGRAPVRRAELPWESRPAAELPFRGCALTPTHQPDFRHAQRLLRGIWQAALDTVPLFVIVSSDAEAALWTASAGSHMEIAPHEVLSLEQVAPDGERNLSTIEDKIAKAAPRPCAMAAGQGRAMGHIKKFYGLKYLGLTRGCDVVWALDCDSMPMRAFSFSEVFSRLGIVWVHEPFLARAHQQWGDSVGGLAASDMVDGRCIKNAQRTHKLMLGQQVARMALRQNDFWLYETRLLLEMMDGAVHGMPPGSSFLDAFLQGGLTSEQVVWLSWLVQHILNKALPNYTIANYTIATIAGNSRSLASCMNQTSTWVPPSNNLFREVALTPGFSYAKFGRFWYDVLGQAGVWGNYLAQLCPDADTFMDFVESVPWCVSNCQQTGLLRLNGAMGNGRDRPSSLAPGHLDPSRQGAPVALAQVVQGAGAEELVVRSEDFQMSAEGHPFRFSCEVDLGFQELKYKPSGSSACRVRRVYDVSLPQPNDISTRRLLQQLGFTAYHTLRPSFQEVSSCMNASGACGFYDRSADSLSHAAFEGVPTFGLACALAAQQPDARFILITRPFSKAMKSMLCQWSKRHCGEQDDHQKIQDLLYGAAYGHFCGNTTAPETFRQLCAPEARWPAQQLAWGELGLEREWREVATRHAAEVRACVPAGRLLELQPPGAAMSGTGAGTAGGAPNGSAWRSRLRLSTLTEDSHLSGPALRTAVRSKGAGTAAALSAFLGCGGGSDGAEPTPLQG